MENIKAFQAVLQSPKDVVVITHFKPDADALGSSLGLAGYLRKKGHRVTVITPSDYPSFLSWMPGNQSVVAVSPDQPDSFARAQNHIRKADLIFCLDFSTPRRVESLENDLRASTATKVLIDHHLEPENFAQFTQWDVKAASTAGLILQLFEELGDMHLLDPDIANCLYAGLMTDTGGFRHSNTSQREFEMAAVLTRAGASPSQVYKHIYDTNSIERLRLTGYVLCEKLKVLPEFNTAYMTLSWQELNKFGSQTGDTEGLVNYGLSIKGIRLAVLMYDRKSEIKISFRSLGSFSVNELARKHFKGGGHLNAAGGMSTDSLEATLNRFLSILPDYKKQLTQPE